jgi:uncharacterized protein (DUF433 family)
VILQGGESARVIARRVTMSEPMIVSDPKVMMGKPVVAGTRVTVDLILEKLGSGESIEAVLESHPRLTRAGILAALRFAAQALRAEVVYPLSTKTA